MSNTPENQATAPAADHASPDQTLAAPTAVAELVPEVPDHAARPAYHRALAPDIARGFMLLFIALANIPWYIHGFEGTPSPGLLDRVTTAVQTIAINARTFPMFAFLFGYGMVQFYNSRRAQGLSDKAVRVMLRRRHWGMLLIGAIHFVLLFEGDVVGAYGLTGLIIVAIFFRRRDKTTLVWTLIWYGVLLGLGIFSFVSMLIWPEAATTAADSSAGMLGSITTSVSHQNYFEGFWMKFVMLPVSYLAQAIISPFAAMMMLGWLAARRRYLEDAHLHTALLRKVAIIGIAVGWLAGVPGALVALGLFGANSLAANWDMSLSTWLGSFAGIGYVALFGLLAVAWQSRPGKAVLAIANVGSRSLSSYLLQSVVFAPLLSAWGFGLGYQLGAFPAALIAIATWGLSVGFCWWLAARGSRGPAEIALRKITYGAHG